MFHQGVVENNVDTEKLGRVQVRIVGKHPANKSTTDTKEYYPVDDLPWAIPVFPVNSSMISQVGDFKVPEQGSVVVVGFFDSEEQNPFYIGTLVKTPTERPDFSAGFTDPDQVFPTTISLDKSSIPDNAQGTDACTNSTISNSLFTEPSSEYATVYPENRVIQTRSGHIIEIDDTDGKERIRIYHKSGSFIEFFPDGKNVMKAIDNNYIITLKDNNLHIGQNENKYIEGNLNHDIGTNSTVTIGGASSLDVTGNVTENIGGNLTITVDGSVNVVASGTATVQGSSGILKGTSNTLTVS